jgi:YbbR domain-containing protein
VARLARFVFRNWPLKLAAVGLAFVFYTGLVVSQGVRVLPGPVQIEAVNQPSGAFLLEPLGNVTDIRFSALAEIASRVGGADFRATVDLRDVLPQSGGAPSVVPVRVTSTDPRIQVVDFRPQQVAVRLDRVIERTVSVDVDRGPIPEGLILGQPEFSSTTVRVRGAASLVERVWEAVARVSIDASAINVDADVPLIAEDEMGQAIQPVDIEPSVVHVRIQVARQRSTRVIPVVPVFSGALATGYELREVTVTPPVVTVSGDESLLSDLNSIATQPIALADRAAPATVEADLSLPAGVTAVDRSRVGVSLVVAPQRSSRSFSVGLTLVGARPDRTYRPASTAILVTLGGPISALNAVDPARLTVAIDVTGLDTGSRDIVARVEPPPGTTVISVGPPRVSVTAEPGGQASPTP